MAKIDALTMATEVFKTNKAFADSGTVREATGRNDGWMLDRVAQIWGLQGQGQPYCAMGAYWAFAKTYCIVNNIPFTEENAPHVFASVRDEIAKEWLKFDPAVVNMQHAAMVHGAWRPFNELSDLRRLRHGDYILFKFPTGHHIGQFDKVEDGKVWLVEWNTTAAGAVGGNSNDPGAGGGCYYKSRTFNSSFWGWIPWTYGK